METTKAVTFTGSRSTPASRRSPAIRSQSSSAPVSTFRRRRRQDGLRIAFAVGNNLSNNIWRASIDPKTGEVAGTPIRITSGVDPSIVPSPSRDGKRLAYLGSAPQVTRSAGPRPGVRHRSQAGGSEGVDVLTLSPDGSMVAFSSDLRLGSAIYVVPTSGGVPRRLCSACGRPVEWSADRTKLLIDNAGPNQREIQIVDVATGRITPMLRHAEFQLTMPRVSPDGRMLVFTQVRPGRERRIYGAPFREELVPEDQWSVLVERRPRSATGVGFSGEHALLSFRTRWREVRVGAARRHEHATTDRHSVRRASPAPVSLQPERSRRRLNRAVGGEWSAVLRELRSAVEHLAG